MFPGWIVPHLIRSMTDHSSEQRPKPSRSLFNYVGSGFLVGAVLLGITTAALFREANNWKPRGQFEIINKARVLAIVSAAGAGSALVLGLIWLLAGWSIRSGSQVEQTEADSDKPRRRRHRSQAL